VLSALCEWGRHHAVELDEIDRLAHCSIKPLQRNREAGAKQENDSGAQRQLAI
jgi:hypothetical protein